MNAEEALYFISEEIEKYLQMVPLDRRCMQYFLLANLKKAADTAVAEEGYEKDIDAPLYIHVERELNKLFDAVQATLEDREIPDTEAIVNRARVWMLNSWQEYMNKMIIAAMPNENESSDLEN